MTSVSGPGPIVGDGRAASRSSAVPGAASTCSNSTSSNCPCASVTARGILCLCEALAHSGSSAMRLLVTGGAGYIGSIVSRRLIAQGHEVVVFDSLERGHREAVSPDAKLIVADLRNADEIDAALSSGFDGVLHFAALALVGESVEHPERYYRTNVARNLEPLGGDGRAQGSEAGVQLDLRGLRAAG